MIHVILILDACSRYLAHQLDPWVDPLELVHVTGQIWCRDGAVLENIVDRFGWHGQRGEMIHVSEGRIRPPVGN